MIKVNLQWGTVDSEWAAPNGAWTPKTFNFPIAFVNDVYATCIPMMDLYTGATSIGLDVTSRTKSSFSVSAFNIKWTTYVSYIAIGY
jgi:hypothetical protein